MFKSIDFKKIQIFKNLSKLLSILILILLLLLLVLKKYVSISLLIVEN